MRQSIKEIRVVIHLKGLHVQLTIGITQCHVSALALISYSCRIQKNDSKLVEKHVSRTKYGFQDSEC